MLLGFRRQYNGFVCPTDDGQLGRGLVATVTQSGSGNFVSWRVLGEEYYDVTYNLYADGVLVAKGLSASNYVHTGGTAETRYTVAPVVKGKEGEQCDPVKTFQGIQFLFPYRTEYRFPQSAGCGNERT